MTRIYKSNQFKQRERGRDYSLLVLKHKDRAAIRLLAFASGFAIGHLFYRQWVAAVSTGLLCGWLGYGLVINGLVKRQQNALIRQFQSLLEVWEAALVSGENIQNALGNALGSLELMYQHEAMIVVEVRDMLLWLQNGKGLAEIISDFAERSHLKAIENFAAVFQVIEGKGEQDRQIIRQTQQLIRETLTIEMEIITLLTSIHTEQVIMLIIPVIVMMYMSFFAEGMFNEVYQTGAGHILATIALLFFGGSYCLSRRLSDIHL